VFPFIKALERPVHLNRIEVGHFLPALRRKTIEPQIIGAHKLNDEDFEIVTSLPTTNFKDMFPYYAPVLYSGKLQSVKEKDLLMFLCKRHGLSDDFLKILFGYRAHDDVSRAVTLVRTSLETRFLPEKVG